MENNIFEGAKFGDKFVTRDGKLALFDEAYDNNRYSLFVQGVYGNIGYHSDGTLCGNISSDKEIVSRYQEPIDEEKLGELAETYANKMHTTYGYYNDWGPLYEGFQAGYRKAKEE